MLNLLCTGLLALFLLMVVGTPEALAAMLCDHEVVLDKEERLQPWTSYDNVLKWSMNFIKHCPTTRTKFGDDPWFLVTSKLQPDGSFMRNQNCQGSHAYWSVETLTRYYAYSGDEEAIRAIKLILDRVLYYHTPADWAWPNVPRTQDNTPDGEYTDETSEADKIGMVGAAYVKFYKLTGEDKYLQAALGIAATLAKHVQAGDAKRSPLPFRVNLRDGGIEAPYSAHMIGPVLLFDELIRLGHLGEGTFQAKRELLLKWILANPMANHDWSGYYEDVPNAGANKNQQSPMETARYILRHPECDPDYKQHVPALIAWVKDRFGKTQRYGATSIREQDCCNVEMSSHTARYASIVAQWYTVTQDPKDREEARASFALTTYSAYSKHSKGYVAINYVGAGYVNPWFIDSYFDYLSHFLEAMADLPELAPENADHLIGTDSIIKQVVYGPKRIEYQAFEADGNEILRLSFKPGRILADNEPLDASKWSYGEYKGVPGVLRIHRNNARHVIVSE